MKTQQALQAAREYFHKLACLGNGDRFGNSEGNIIAQQGLALIDEALAEVQEPVAWQSIRADGSYGDATTWTPPSHMMKNYRPLYAAHPAPAQQDHSVDANKMVAVVNQQLTTDAKLLEACKAFSDYVQAEQCSTDGAVTYSTSTINHHAFSIRAAIAQAEGVRK